MEGFRFKAYLKSNLERLHRDENGTVAWLDRTGSEINILQSNWRDPSLVNSIDTRSSADYTAVLEKIGTPSGQAYNYKKFFAAIAAANEDVWDRAAPTHTSYRPIGNKVNCSSQALENALVSDQVRQFAVTWYLKGEIHLLTETVRSTGVSYGDELHDKALYHAIEKARNYLRPFYAYDLDEIYAICWDSEEGGGSDRDSTTLSADLKSDGYYYGISAYLPYGVYVIVEQQPKAGHPWDFANRHYQIDEPQEVCIPTVYAGDSDSRQSPDVQNSYYHWESALPAEELAAKYQIYLSEKPTSVVCPYAQVLVPFTVTAPAGESSEKSETAPVQNGESSYVGYAYGKFTNRLASCKLRLEKLDSETHENLLHDDAIFGIYAAERDDTPYGNGSVCFYLQDTRVSGTRLFLEAMGAVGITPLNEKLFTGIILEGTPICRESGLVTLGSTGDLQNVGFFETLEPLGAGVYVIAELKPPSGYIRSRPIAVELYSDQISYYREGNKDERTLAVVYEPPAEEGEEARVARIYIENQPVRLKVEKVKEASALTAETTADKMVTFRDSGRVNGTLAEIGNDPSLTYAYSENGTYLGYGWKKGTLERLAARKAAGENVELAFEANVFAGYGFVTRNLHTADDRSPYVRGATMALFAAFPLEETGDDEDHTYKDLVVERNRNNNVTRIFVQETGKAEEADLLFYDLSNLDVFTVGRIAGEKVTYGYDRKHQPIPLAMLESDQENFTVTDKEQAIYAFKGEVPYLEIVTRDFTRITYSPRDKIFGTTTGTLLYHLDSEGNRDALVDPYTGMAYVVETRPDGSEQVLAWRVNIHRDESGSIIARDKITTSRIATLGEFGESREEYLTGSWQSACGEGSHRKTSIPDPKDGQNRNGSILADDNNGRFEKLLKPVFDPCGLPLHYIKSSGIYEQGTKLYDRNGEFVRYQNSDNLKAYRRAAYRIAGTPLHRWGEAYVLQNSWISSDRTPNDPFDTAIMDGQADILKRLPAGSYILEELISPPGFTKGLPSGITVDETAQIRQVRMVDYATKVEIAKIDGSTYEHLPGADLALFEAKRVYTENGYRLERKSGTPVVFCTTNHTASDPEFFTVAWKTGTQPIYIEGLPVGDYLLYETKTPAGGVTGDPVEVVVEDTREVQIFFMKNDHTKIEINKFRMDGRNKAALNHAGLTLYQGDTIIDTWVTDNAADYTETIELRDYPNTSQTGKTGFILEFEDMYRQFGTQEQTAISWAVKRTAVRSSAHDPVWIMEDGTRIQAFNQEIICPAEMNKEDRDGFLAAFQANRRQSNQIHWVVNRAASYVAHTQIDSKNPTNFPASAQILYRTEEGQDIRITVNEGTADRQGRAFTFEYQFDYRQLPHISKAASSYLTKEGNRRFDYLPAGESFRLAETTAPPGYAPAADWVFIVKDVPQVQYYEVENELHSLRISKVSGSGTKELTGNRMALYRASADGSLLRRPEYLVAGWVSGTDGRYTESDDINGRIPAGYRQGDLRPHTITGLDKGVYYLTEVSGADFYTLFEPVQIDYLGEGEIPIARVSNKVAEGELEITKADSEGISLLSGAVFEVSAHVDGSREALFTRTVSTVNGKAALDGLPVGRLLADGHIDPYCYRVKEIIPPDGYQTDTLIRSFCFSPNNMGDSYRSGEAARHTLALANEKTKVYIEKLEFGVGKRFVAGAELAIYELFGRDDGGTLIYDDLAPRAVWITREEERHLVEGLVAGKSYLLVERKAPEGYTPMDPVKFRVSTDGRSILAIRSQLNLITVHTDRSEGSANGRIKSVTISGRYVTKNEMAVYNAKGFEVAQWTGTGNGIHISSANDLAEGELCTIAETTCYSDGTRTAARKTTQRVHFDDKGECFISDRISDGNYFVLTRSDGFLIREFTPNQYLAEETIWNKAGRAGSGHSLGHEVFSPGESYVLEEITRYSDGELRTVSRFQFMIQADGSVNGMGVFNKQNQVAISKRNIMTGTELRGADILIEDMDGNVINSFISDEKPYELLKLEQGKKYKMVEVRPPSGFSYAPDIPFQVQGDGTLNLVVMDDLPTTVRVRKENRLGELIGGAHLQIRDHQGRIIDSFVTEPDQPYEIVGRLNAGEVYTLHETRAPSGYSRAEDIIFSVGLESGVDTVTMVDSQISRRDKMEKREGKTGWITVRYEGGKMVGKVEGLVPHGRLAKTGDPRMRGFWLISMLFFLLAFIIIREKQRMRLRVVCILIWIVLFLFQILMINSFVSYGSQPEYSTLVSGAAICRDVEAIDEIPDVVPVEVWDERSGEKKTAVLPITGKEILEERWVDDFEFPLLYHNYPADNYQLGELVIAKEEVLVIDEEIERQLLELLGLSREDYKITAMEWDGEPFSADSGEQCRQAKAYGWKKKRDYRLSYAGAIRVGLPSDSLAATVQSIEAEDIIILAEPGVPPETTGPAAKAQKPVPAGRGPMGTLRKMIAISIGISILILLIAFILWLITLREKKKPK